MILFFFISQLTVLFAHPVCSTEDCFTGDGLWDNITDNDISEGKFYINNGTGEWSFPVQKNAEIEKITTSLFTNQRFGTPTLSVDSDGVLWRFPEEQHGKYNIQNEFVGGDTIYLDIHADEERSFGVQIPLSTIRNGHFFIGRDENDKEYHVEIMIDDTSIWTRSSTDRLYGNPEILASGSNLRSADQIYNQEGSYVVAGGLPGTVNLYDAESGEKLAEYNPDSSWVMRLVFVPWVDHDPVVIALGRTGEIHKIAYNSSTGDFVGEFMHMTQSRNRILFTHDISGNDRKDIFTLRDNELLVSYNNESGIIQNFTVLHTLPYKPNHVSVTNDGKLIIACSQRAQVGVFEYVNGSLEHIFDIPYHEPVLHAFGIEFNGDGNMDILVHDQLGNIDVLVKNDGGNYNTSQYISYGRGINGISVADVNQDGLDDLFFTSYPEKRSYVYINQGNELIREYDFSMINGGLEIHTCDFEGDGDIDLLMVSNNHVYLASNKMNWINEKVNDITIPIQTYMDTATPSYDSWGNPIINVPFTVRSLYDTNLTVSDLLINYDYRPNIDMTTAVSNYVAATPANETGWVNVPLIITADNDGTFDVRVTVAYNERAPVLQRPIPETYTVVWNKLTPAVIDLSEYFHDPAGLDLIYTVTYQEDQNELEAFVDGTHINFYSKTAEEGRYSFRVRANNGLRTQDSNLFAVTVVPPSPTMELPDRIKVRESETAWFDCSPYITGLEPFGENRSLTTSSPHITVHDNLTMELYYTTSGHIEPVTATLNAGTYTVNDLFTVEVMSSNAPFFMPLPQIFMEKNTSLGEGDGIYLPDHVEYTGPGELVFTITKSSDPAVNVSLSNNWVVAYPPEDYHGASIITVRVEENVEGLSDRDTFKLTVNNTLYPPTYLGTLENAEVFEDGWWTVNLRNHFDYELSDKLRFRSNRERVRIVNISWALWRPEYGDDDVIGLSFTAYDWEYPALEAFSDPISLRHITENQPPRYTGGLYSRVVQLNTTWSVHLPDHFHDREDPNNMTYSCTHHEIHIDDNWTASWTPDEDSHSLHGVVFTAYDAQDPDLNATSNPISLMVPGKEGPLAVIISITPGTARVGEMLWFRGGAEATVGNVSYQWRSNRDGLLSELNEFNITLSAGNHLISLRVMDERGNWSEDVTRTITIESEDVPAGEETAKFYHSSAFRMALVVVIIGLTLNSLGRELIIRKERWA